ncbi:MAG TPA: amidohydrolase [Thermoanaerobaculia bacterium]|nr:amidohydrolase [Thermoanaerobaculia bacterium]
MSILRTWSWRAVLLVATIAISTGSAAGQAPAARVEEAVAALTPRIVEIRHWIHQNPELSNREVQTAELVAGHLKALGIEVRTGIARTGVVGFLKGGRPGPVVALRADMDALPVVEETSLPFKSTVRTTYNGQEVGVMHACGHDVHTAVMLGVASVLAPLRDELPGSVLFIFQPAEEGPPPGEEGGAALMLAEGLFRDVRPSALFGLHSDAEMPVGQVGYTPGATNASNDNFVITLTGRQAHAAWPHLAVDPIVMASQAVLALQTIRSRNLSPFAPSVITVAQIHGGLRDNIIPPEVKLSGTVRLFDPAAQDEVERRMREILDGIAKAAGGSFQLEYKRKVPVLRNDPELVRRMLPTVERTLGLEQVKQIPPAMASDDFGFFAAEVPAFFFHLGTVKPGTKSGSAHTATFLADDGAIPVGIRVTSHLVLDYLQR